MANTARGHIEQLPSGSFRVHVYAKTDPITGRPRRLRETCPDDATAAGGTITNTITVANTGSAASSGTVTVNAYAPVSGGSYSGSGWTCTSQGVCATNTPVPAGGTLPPITITSTAPTGRTQANQPESDLTNISDGDTNDNDAYTTTWTTP
jgi:hypothetical protein